MPRMPTISDDEAALVVRALEHYHAYLIAAKREDRAYEDLAERLRRGPPAPAVIQAEEKRKKA
jgi:hypothetical protein